MAAKGRFPVVMGLEPESAPWADPRELPFGSEGCDTVVEPMVFEFPRGKLGGELRELLSGMDTVLEGGRRAGWWGRLLSRLGVR